MEESWNIKQNFKILFLPKTHIQVISLTFTEWATFPYIYSYMYEITISEKEAITLKESEENIFEGLQGGIIL